MLIAVLVGLGMSLAAVGLLVVAILALGNNARADIARRKVETRTPIERYELPSIQHGDVSFVAGPTKGGKAKHIDVFAVGKRGDS